MILGKFEEARNFYEQVLEVRGKLTLESEKEKQYEAQLKALFWCEIGQTWRYVGDSNQAKMYFGQAEEFLYKAGIDRGPAWAKIRFQQGNLYWREGNYERARKSALESLQMFEESLQLQGPSNDSLRSTRTMRTLAGNPVDLGRTHELLANIVVNMGLNNEAMEHFNIALEIFEQYDYKREIANVCCNLGDLYLRICKYTSVRPVLHRSLSIAEQIGNKPLTSIGLGNLGVLSARLGNLVEAEHWYKQALALAEQVNDPFYISLLHSYLTLTLIKERKIEEAKSSLIQALKIGRAKNISYCIGLALVTLGRLRIAQALVLKNKISSANEKYNRSLECLIKLAKHALDRALTYEGLEAETKIDAYLALAEIALLSKDTHVAFQRSSQALKESQMCELIWLIGNSHCLLGRVSAFEGKQTTANEYFQQALSVFKNITMNLEYARTLYAYAEIFLQTSKDAATREQARRYLQEARQTFQECGAALDLQLAERVLNSLKGGRGEGTEPGARAGAAFTESGAGSHGRERPTR
jgi:tetratricopeptide (TPR) repeat protein